MERLLDLIPHRRPWLLLDRVVEVGQAHVTAEKRLSAGDPLLAGGLPELLVIEALAQAAACLRGAQAGAHRGMLVQASGFTFDGRAQAGETLTLTVTRTATLGTLHRFEGEARAGERLIARGQMTFAVGS
ncbi:MAG TPA: hypothetical protein VII38_21210 [Polyangia bacterium]|jgi:3-hydroxyacyl-[acyl-carrier-protein] dehydratase